MRTTSFLLAIVTTLAPSACTNDTTVGENVGAASGTLTAAAGHVIPESAATQVFWSVTSGSPDYTYAFGEGSSRGDTFTVDLPGDPPADALNGYGIGVGVIALATRTLPEGRVTVSEESFESSVLGAAGGYALVYKEEGATDLFWTTDFPVGLSCGIEDPSRVDGPFTGFRPVDCSTIVITIDDPANIHFTNWT